MITLNHALQTAQLVLVHSPKTEEKVEKYNDLCRQDVLNTDFIIRLKLRLKLGHKITANQKVRTSNSLHSLLHYLLLLGLLPHHHYLPSCTVVTRWWPGIWSGVRALLRATTCIRRRIHWWLLMLHLCHHSLPLHPANLGWLKSCRHVILLLRIYDWFLFQQPHILSLMY